MPPPAKKQTVEEDLPPVVFKQPGMKCDTRLLVFQQEFQVHSMILKLHSAFFRKFLDSPEKGDIHTQDGWQYNWVSKIDDNESDDEAGWHLISTKNYTKPKDLENSKVSTQRQNRFHDLLCAFYVRPYTIDSLNNLKQLVTLADYYCSLPIVSRTLNAAMLANENINQWYWEIEDKSGVVLLLATRLRNALLLRDALILHVSDWTNPRNKVYVSDAKLQKIAENAYNKIASLISKFYLRSHEDGDEMAGVYKTHAEEAKDQFGALQLPLYFKLIKDDRDTSPSKSMSQVITELLNSNLAFPNDEHVAGAGIYPNRFLCAWVDDEDLPWDRDEIDW